MWNSTFPAAIYGVDLCDLHVAIAPRPLLATKENYSSEFTRWLSIFWPATGNSAAGKFATEEAATRMP